MRTLRYCRNDGPVRTLRVPDRLVGITVRLLVLRMLADRPTRITTTVTEPDGTVRRRIVTEAAAL